MRLRKSLTTVAEYEAFRTWADPNCLDHHTVKDSVHAWASFALGANRLFLNEPEIKIEGLSVATSATLPGGGEVGGGQGAPRPTVAGFVSGTRTIIATLNHEPGSEKHGEMFGKPVVIDRPSKKMTGGH